MVWLQKGINVSPTKFFYSKLSIVHWYLKRFIWFIASNLRSFPRFLYLHQFALLLLEVLAYFWSRSIAHITYSLIPLTGPIYMQKRVCHRMLVTFQHSKQLLCKHTEKLCTALLALKHYIAQTCRQPGMHCIAPPCNKSPVTFWLVSGTD